MYNQAYITDFLKENKYKEFLNNPVKLTTLKEEYFKKYGNESNAYYLAFKESLDHYVAKQISDNTGYINTIEFKNYANYIKEVVRENCILIGQNKIYLELNTNVVFDYLDDVSLNNIFGNNSIKSHREYNNTIIHNCITKINNNENINNSELNILCRFFDNKKNFNSIEFQKNYDKFIKYILKNRENLKTSPELISSILTFLPSYYKEGVENSRTFLVKYDSATPEKFPWAHSSGAHDYTAFQIKDFKNLNLNSNKSLDSSRTFKENDLMFLMFAQFHELTHQAQKLRTKKNTFDINALPYEVKEILRLSYNDYSSRYYSKDDPRNFEGNHDSDEIEIEADEIGWKKLSWFIFDYIEKDNQDKTLTRKCSQNAKAINCRRSFSIKKHPDTGKRARTINYDMDNLIQAVKQKPRILENFAHVKSIINEKGEINIDFLFENKITMTPAGRTISNYILSNVPEQLFIDKIHSNKYSKEQIINLIENFVEVPHANALTLRELKNVDLRTYQETQAKFKITEENLDDVYNTYFVECSNQLLKFSKILENTKSRLGEKYIAGCYKFYIENYYKEMLENIKCPRSKEIENIMQNFKDTGNEVLVNTAEYTLSTLSHKQMQNNAKKIAMNFARDINVTSIAPIANQTFKNLQQDSLTQIQNRSGNNDGR